jgi:predicted kinase
METKQPKLYVLVGVPGSGKSTWVNNQSWMQDCVYISTDKHVETYAKKVGRTYIEVFDEIMPDAVHIMTSEVVIARENRQDIVWDQTSTSIKSRAKKFRMLPDYYAIAVVFRTPDAEELQRRLDSRPGKTIPPEVIADMIDNFEMPTEQEGFKEIWYA